MQIRQRQTRLKHASETDDKLCFLKYAVYFRVSSLFSFQEKKSYIVMGDSLYHLLSSFQKLKTFVLFAFALLCFVFFSSLYHKSHTPPFNSKSPFTSTPLESQKLDLVSLSAWVPGLMVYTSHPASGLHSFQQKLFSWARKEQEKSLLSIFMPKSWYD